MLQPINPQVSSDRVRTSLFLVLLLLITVVMDGLPKVASPFIMQILLLPLTAVFLATSFYFLHGDLLQGSLLWLVKLSSEKVLLWTTGLLQLCFVYLFLSETHHYSALGYRLLKAPVLLSFGMLLLALGVSIGVAAKIPSRLWLAIFLATSATGSILSIVSFPLNYLRSDMLPVIFWADRALLGKQNPYQHFYVADRVYDFPYLPGMLLAFAPAQALHLDPRWAALVYLVAGMCLIYGATAVQFRHRAVLLIGLFMLCPYLQYRHELYTQGHFFSLILVFFLMQRRHFAWAAAAFGLSMVISQFSWVIFPFFLLNALRRGSWKEVFRMAAFASLTALVLLSPFLTSGTGTIARNAVGQWDSLAHPIARPINLSFWASYLIRPAKLKWLQLTILSVVFCFCWLDKRCADLADSLRWMITALTIFILLNVIVDGYFYLMLLVPMLVYTCVANGWWAEADVVATRRTSKFAL